PVFFALARGQALTQKELAEQAAIEQPTMAATLKRMEAQGLVEKRPDPRDGRSALISLTPKALRLSEAVRNAGHMVNAEALAGLEPGEAERYRQLLLNVIGSLQAHLKS